MGELIVPKPDYHAGSACHPGVDSIVPKEQAECRVMRVGLAASDHVTGVYVLKVNLHAGLFEILLDTIAKQDADITILDITGGVTFSRCFAEFLSGALSNNDHGMAPPLDPLLQGRKEDYPA